MPDITTESLAIRLADTLPRLLRHVPHSDTHLLDFPHASLRVGTDLVEINAIADSVSQFGNRYLSRVFTTREVAYCAESAPHFAARLAARFAAKESVLKILRPQGAWPEWHNIEVVRHAHGWCEIALHGAAATLASFHETRIVSCSLTHEGPYASAVVIGLAQPC